MTFVQRRILALSVLLICTAACVAGASLLWSSWTSSAAAGDSYAKAEILDIKDKYVKDQKSVTAFSQQTIKLQILSGQYSGEIIETVNTTSGNPLVDVDLTKGALVMVTVHQDNGRLSAAAIDGAYRINTLILVTVAVVLLLIIIGGLHGLRALFIAALAMFGVFGILVPAVTSGTDPITVLIVVCTCLSIAIILTGNGFNLVSFTALAGMLTACLLAAAAAYKCLDSASISGFASIESRMGYYMEHFTFNMELIFFCGVVLSSLGALADICLEIASKMSLLGRDEPDMYLPILFMEGINAGRVRMQSLVSVLCMAFCGVLLPWLAFYSAYSDSARYIINSELAAGEIVRLAACCLALCAALPVTAAYGAAAQAVARHSLVASVPAEVAVNQPADQHDPE